MIRQSRAVVRQSRAVIPQSRAVSRQVARSAGGLPPTEARRGSLLGISHGTASASGQRVVRELVAAVAERSRAAGLAGEVRLGHVDVQQPGVGDVLQSVDVREPAVIVPLLLSTGYHARVDLRQQSRGTDHAVGIAPALGPDARLVQLLEERLQEIGARPGEDVIVLGAAGSSDEAAIAACRETAAMLADRLDAPVADAYLAHAEPSVAGAVQAARARHPGCRVVVASYLLAPGFFQSKLEAADGDLTTAPLLAPARDAPPEQLIDLVIDRYLTCLGGFTHGNDT